MKWYFYLLDKIFGNGKSKDKNINRLDKKALKCHNSLYKVAFFLGICLFSMIFLSSVASAFLSEGLLFGINENASVNLINGVGADSMAVGGISTSSSHGYINNGFGSFSSTSTYIINSTLSNGISALSKYRGITMAIAINATGGAGGYNRVIKLRVGASQFGYGLQFRADDANALTAWAQNTGGECFTYDASKINDTTGGLNKWYLVVAVFNLSGDYLYNNGTLIAHNTADTGGCTYNYSVAMGELNIGKDGSEFLTGDLDEIYIWNRTLNPAEITEFNGYMNNKISFPFPQPNGTIIFISPTPANNSYLTFAGNLSSISINTSINVSDYNRTEFYLYNENMTLLSTLINDSYPIAYRRFSSLPNSIYYFSATAFNNTGGSISTETRKRTLDNIPPYFENLANTGAFYNKSVNFTGNFVDIYALKNWSFSHNMSGVWINVSTNITTLNENKNVSVNYTLFNNRTRGTQICGYFWGYDMALNYNQSALSCYIVQNSPPVAIPSYPKNINLTTNHFTYNWTATDIDNDTITNFNLYTGQDINNLLIIYSGSAYSFAVDGVPSGINYWMIESTDSFNASGNSTIANFTIKPPTLRIYARDLSINTSINTFSAILFTINGTGYSYSTTTGIIAVNLTFEVWYYNISAPSYTDKTGSVYMDASKNITLYLQKPSTINVQIYNENNTLANGILTSLLFISETQAYSILYTTSTGTKYISYIPSDIYQLKYNASNYRNGVYYFNINTTASASIKLYLISNTSTQIFINLYDINGNILPGYIIKALRFDTDTNNWEFYQMSKTDDNGIATMFFTPFDNYYQFVVEKDGIVYLTTASRLVYGDFSLIINPLRVDVLPMLTASNIAYNLSYDDSGSGFFRFQYNDLNGIVVRGCLNVKNPLSSQYLCSQCSDSTSAVLICNLNASNSSVLLAQGVITYLSDDYTIATLEKNFTTNYQTFGAGGIFYVALLVLALSLLALWHPIVAIAMAIIAMILSGIIGLFYLTFTAGVVLVILGLVYMVLMRK